MCRKFVLVSNLDRIENRFQVHINQNTLPIPESFSLGVDNSSYVIISENPHEIQVMKFGMTPFWAKTPMDLINARAEGDKNKNDDPYYNGANSIFLKAAFKKPIQSQRCLVIADAYFEWAAGNKPYLVFLQNKERPFAFAGVYDRWKNPETGEMLTTFAIITTTANDLLQSIGVKRMPVILTKSNEKDWIKTTKHLSEVLGMLNQFPVDQMNAYPVSDLVNNPEINDISMINPIGEKLQADFEIPTRIIRPYRMHKEKTPSDISWFENRQNDTKY